MGEQVGEKWPSIATNLVTVDEEALGCGGIPRGRIVEVYGPESSGKTTFCLHVIAEAQKAGGVAAFVDAEHSLDPTYAAKLGVDMDSLLVSQPDNGEQALEVTEALVESGGIDVLVIDSVAALVPQAELDGEMGDSHMGLQARLMSQAMRKLVGVVAKTKTAVIFINQIREKVGLVFGNPEVTTGGRGLKFAAAQRIEVRKVSGQEGTFKDGEKHIGHKMRIKVVKNKMAKPFRETTIDLYYDTGFDKKSNLIDYAISLGIVTPGAWCLFEGQKYRKDDLTDDPVYGMIKCRVEEKLNEA